MCDDGCTIKSRCFAYVCPSVRHLKNLNIQCEGRSLAGEVETDGNNALPIDDRTIAVTILCMCVTTKNMGRNSILNAIVGFP